MRRPIVAAGLALAALALASSAPSFAQTVALGDFTFGVGLGAVKNDLGSSVALSGSVESGGAVTAGSIENTVGDATLTTGLAKVTYHASPVANPYLLVGLASLSFDDAYRLSASDLGATFDEKVGVKGSGVAVGLGAEGKLLKLPAMLTLGYSAQVVTFKGSDDNEITVEEVSEFDAASVSTDFSYVEWDLSVTVSRDIPMQGNLVLTPYGGLRHASVHMNVDTAIEYRPYINGQPAPLSGTYSRPVDGNLLSIVAGCAGALGRNLTGYLQFVVLGQTGAEAGVAYRF